jgi:hypothetical protein
MLSRRIVMLAAALLLSSLGMTSETSAGFIATPTPTPLLCNRLVLTLCIQNAESTTPRRDQACDDERKLVAAACDGGPIVKPCAKALSDLSKCLRICRQVFTKTYRGCFSSYRKCVPGGAVPCPTPPAPN